MCRRCAVDFNTSLIDDFGLADPGQVLEQQLQQQFMPLSDVGGSESEWFVSDQEEELIRLLSTSESSQPVQRTSDLLLLL